MSSTMQRRDFLKISGAITALSLSHRVLAGPSQRISIIVEGTDPCASSDPVGWAAGRLRNALVAKGVVCEIVSSSDQAAGSAFSVLVAGAASGLAEKFPPGGCAPQQSREPPSYSWTVDGRAGDLGFCRRTDGDLSTDCWS